MFAGTILAYGQTGTGKTYTMSGRTDSLEHAGIIPNSFAHIFNSIAKCEQDKTFLVRVSYLEIYNEEIRDLLARSPMHRLEIKVSLKFDFKHFGFFEFSKILLKNMRYLIKYFIFKFLKIILGFYFNNYPFDLFQQLSFYSIFRNVMISVST